MVKISVVGARSAQCKKPGCLRGKIARHHRGSEAMWLRHFLHKRRQKTFRDFKKRYYAFLPEDVVPICDWHHAEIHDIYAPIIRRWVRTHGFKPCSAWRWKQANALIDCLRAECDRWLLLETPGRNPTSHSRPD